ncbi:hypothetical protein ASPFODRAFT_302173 [Aspergillus luchuensis CBS 106.47]|uniref:Uncharacterized protein n=1 Tax=Aspergillus luchuensis (strain CBS 106.47) TaxID=1137211 RepID=A0A1M3TBF1_ASPLC|nr:hypothetical protein ASPFODRAFT_302173 [Aspergillus luchuensis CBS 106.47]
MMVMVMGDRRWQSIILLCIVLSSYGGLMLSCCRCGAGVYCGRFDDNYVSSSYFVVVT